eukprot:GHVU01070532.1.p1 GENE.GHVU01070532.1~~GHVU01070532.1.p1  ORF type:complete len:155 (+),score=28.16 GHVU01070532.1:448-912(+)
MVRHEPLSSIGFDCLRGTGRTTTDSPAAGGSSRRFFVEEVYEMSPSRSIDAGAALEGGRTEDPLLGKSPLTPPSSSSSFPPPPPSVVLLLVAIGISDWQRSVRGGGPTPCAYVGASQQASSRRKRRRRREGACMDASSLEAAWVPVGTHQHGYR